MYPQSAYIATLQKIGSLLVLGLIGICSMSAHSQQQASPITLTFKHLSVNEGLSTNSIKSLVADDKDIWLGTYAGITRFDGRNIKHYGHIWGETHSLYNNLVTKLYRNSRGVIWACSSGAVNQYLPEQDGFKSYPFSSVAGTEFKSAICNDVVEDNQHNLWIVTNKGLFFIDHQSNQLRWVKETEGHYLVSVAQKNTTTLWLASLTKGTGLYEFNIQTRQMSKVPTLETVSDSFGIYTMLRDNNGQLLVGSHGEGVFSVVERHGKSYLKKAFPAHKALNNTFVQNIYSHTSGLWIATRNKGLFFISKDNLLQHVTLNPGPEQPHQNVNIQSIHIDKEAILWLATFDGLYYAELRSMHFNQNNIAGFEHIEGAPVSSFVKMSNGLWVSSIGKGIIHISPQDDVTHLTPSQSNDNGLISDRIRSMLAINETLYLATEKGPQYLSAADNQFQPLKDKYGQAVLRYASTLFHDSQDRLWVGFQSAVGVYSKEGNEIAFFDRATGVASGPVLSFAQDSDSRIWVSSLAAGLTAIEQDLSRYQNIDRNDFSGEPYNKPAFAIQPIEQQGLLWLGSSQGLQLVDMKNQRLIHQEPLGKVLSIEKSGSHLLWLATEKGLYKFDTVAKQILEYYSKDDGVINSAFVRGASFQDEEGRLYFGGKKGLNYFVPSRVKLNPFAPVAIAKLTFLDNNRHPAQYDNGGLELFDDHLEVKSHYDNLVIHLGSSSRANATKNRFRVQLVGYDASLRELPPGQFSVTYTNLPSGQYQLRMQASNNSGLWGKEEIKNAFKLEHPFWLRWYAWLFFCFLNILAIWALVSWRSIYIEQKNRKLQKIIDTKTQELAVQKEQLQKTLSYKEEFLANISHELKTPLTLMLGVMSGKGNEAERHQKLKRFIQRISLMLDNMISLSKSKLTSNQSDTKHYFYTHEVVEFYFTVYASFVSSKRLVLVENQAAVIHCEHDTIDKIVTNLINNAIKYSISDTPINITSCIIDKQWHFSVENQSKGMTELQINAAFERYVQLSDAKNSYGLGLGLPLVKSLVENMGGNITLDSQPHKSTKVTVKLPIFEDSQTLKITSPTMESSLEEYRDWITAELNHSTSKEQTFKKTSESGTSPHDKPLLYCVDDNTQLLNQLEEQLSHDFNPVCFNDPLSLLEKAKETLPDIIISDVMMPELSGFDLIKRVRSDELISHIPVILLTAKTDKESQQSGLLSMADDYITKPYDPQLLSAKAQALVNIRALLRTKFEVSTKQDSQEKSSNEKTPLQVTLKQCAPNQTEFMEKVLEHIQQNLSNPSFGVKELSECLHYSESQLRRKIKAISGHTPQDIIRIIRLEAAAELVLQGKSLKSIAQDIGFSTQSHMGSVFKAYYGLTPKQYRDENSRTEA
ncbi:ATP-binding protein [Pleionea sp. CnH1-48]|uniref:hybrid sensor histidine kinase/response regulator transcription factor n=1 Tax=Pleionea sp. CnH1-48 TaxID=2954494 RepID=UPI002097C7DE|nr:ATP-binding protein [Pleionea sp. CnH1-48]MCO7223289.1 response regulator [Pleionea sp. CnH1-48]